MVAVVAGQFSGLFDTSLTLLGSAKQGQGTDGVFVNAATGNLVLQGQDNRLVGLGADLGVVRTYNSQGDLGDDIGQDNWRLGFLSSLSIIGALNSHGSELTRITAGGATQRFQYDSSQGKYVSDDGVGSHDTIEVASNGSAVYSDGSGERFLSYDNVQGRGRLVAILDKEGRGQHLTYSGERLQRIVSDVEGNRTETTRFIYDDTPAVRAQNRLLAIELASGTGDAQKRYSYEYDNLGRLDTITVDLTPQDDNDGAVYVTRYDYVGSGNLIRSIEQSDGTRTSFTYVGDKVRTVTDGENNVTTFTYNSTTETTVEVGGTTYTIEVDEQQRLKSKTSVVNSQEVKTRYRYDARGNVERVTDGLGHHIDYGYDSAGNQIWQQDAEGRRLERTFNAANKPLTETVFFGVDSDGLSGSAQASQPQTQYFVYDNNNRLRFTVSPNGEVSELRYNSLGQLAQSRNYTTDRYNTSGFSPSSVPSLTQLTAWVSGLGSYDEHDLQLTEYRYDYRGNVDEQTTYQAVGASGDGINGDTTHFTYDINGRLLSQRGPQYTSNTTYDGLGRVLTREQGEIDGQTRTVSSTVYDDANQKIVITHDNKLVTTRTYDRAGQLVTLEQGDADDSDALQSEARYYDEHNREVARRHANGAISYRLYDGAGRLAYEVDRAGAVTSYEYDRASQLKATTQYSDLVDTAGWLVNGKLVKTSNGTLLAQSRINTALVANSSRATDADRAERLFYDDSGALIHKLDAAGFITEYRYDGAGRQTHVLAYAETDAGTVYSNRISIKSGEAFRVTRQFYDNDGQLLAMADSEGFVTQYHYDQAGQKIAEQRYANAAQVVAGQALTPEQLRDASFDQLRLSQSSEDRVSQYRYNGKGELTLEVNADGKVTQYEYNTEGLLERKVEYARRQHNSSVSATLVIPAPHGNDRVMEYSYNDFGLIEKETAQDRGDTNQLTYLEMHYKYDKANNLIATTQQGKAGSDARTTLVGRDALGRELGQLDGTEASGLRAQDAEVTSAHIANLLTSDGTERRFDSAGRLLSSKDSEGQTRFFYYDARNQVKAILNSDGQVQTFTYNAFGEQTRITEYRASAMSAVASLTGGAIDEIDGLLQSLSSSAIATRVNTYTQRGLLDVVTSGNQQTVDNDYNAFGEVAKRTTQLSHTQQRVDEYRYDNRGLLLATVVDKDGIDAVNRSAFDAFGRVRSQTDALGNVTRFDYADDQGRVLTSYETANGTVTERVEYDVFGRTVKVVDGENRETVHEYKAGADSVEHYIHHNDEQATRLLYNAHGELTDRIRGKFSNGQLSEVLSHVHYEYNEDGMVVRETQGYNSPQALVTEYVYNDNEQRVQTIVDPDGEPEITRYAYNAQGQVISITDAENEVTRNVYDGQGNLTYVLDKADVLMRYDYDADGRLTGTRTFEAAQTPALTALINQSGRDKATVDLSVEALDQWEKGLSYNNFTAYDKAGRAVLTVDATGGVVQHEYNGQNLVTKTVRFARVVDLSDAQRRQLAEGNLTDAQLAQLIPSANPLTDQVTAAVYDEKGQVRFSLNKTAQGQAIVKESQYDQAGLLTATRTFASTIAYSDNYDLSDGGALLSWVQSAQAQEGNRSSWLFYDNSNKLRFTLDSLGGVTESQYNELGQLVKSNAYAKPLSEHRALRAAFNTGTLTYAQLDAQLTGQALAPSDRSTETRYDEAGRIKQVIETAGNNQSYEQSWSYYRNGLKASYQDKRGGTWQYFYDNSGRLSREVGPQVADIQVAKAGLSGYDSVSGYRTTDFVYDDLGNVTKRQQGYVLSGVADIASAALQGKVTATFGYDAMGRQNTVSEGQEDIDSRVTNAPTTQVNQVYDALGNSVVNHVATHDLKGNKKDIYQYRVYDEIGRLAYEVDGNGFVTQHTYDAQSNLVYVDRFEQKLSLTGHTAGTEITLAQIKQASLGNARRIENVYNSLGQKVRVIQPAISYADVDKDGRVTTRRDRPETEFTYNRFGEVIRQREKVSQNTFAVTLHYYDGLGQKRYSIDPQGYLSEWQYNAFGDVSRKIDYAEAITHSSSELEPAGGLHENNRIWEYRYDNLGRQTHEIQKQVVVHERSTVGTNGVKQDVTVATYYDGEGNITQVDNNGYSSYSQFDAYNRVSATWDEASDVIADATALTTGLSTTKAVLTTEFKYDSYGNVVLTAQGAQQTDAQGRKGVDEQHQESRVSQQFYNERQQLIKSVDAVGAEKAFTYDYAGNIVQQRDSFAVKSANVTYTTQIETRVVNERSQEDDFYAPRSIVSAFPSWLTLDSENGRLVGTAPTLVHFDAIVTVAKEDDATLYTRKIEIIRRAGETVDVALDGWAYSQNGINDQVAQTTYTYDNAGQRIKVERARLNGEEKTVEAQQDTQYNSYGEIVFQGDESDSLYTATSGQPLQVYFKYNDAGQLIRSNVNDGIDKRYEYDLQGNLVKQSHLTKGETVSLYDLKGQVLKQYQAEFVQDGVTIKPSMSQTLDRWGNIIRAVDSRGYVTNYEYDHNNKLTKEQRPLTKVVDNTGKVSFIRPSFSHYYDDLGRLIASKDANGEVQHFAYAENGLKTAETDKLGFTTRYGYNLFGEQVAKQDANGYLTVKRYDNAGQVIESGDIRDNEQGVKGYQLLSKYVYDDLGNRTVVENALGYQFYYRYDTQGNLLESVSPNGLRMSYEYDGRGNRTLLRYDQLGTKNSDLDNIVSHYDYFSRMSSSNDLGGNETQYNYSTGNLDSRTFDLGGDDSVDQTVTYDYYSNGLVKSIHQSDNEASTVFKYNSAGMTTEEVRTTNNALGEKRTEITQTSYDSNGRVNQVIVKEVTAGVSKIVSAISYSYDAMGNRRNMQVVNGYTGNVGGAVNTAPVYNAGLEGYSYAPATYGYDYSWSLGAPQNIFFDADGDELNYEVVAYPGQTLPDWIKVRVDKDDLGNEQLIMYSEGKVPNRALEDTRFMIRAYEVDRPDEHFTLLPIILPVKQDLAPRFADAGTKFGDLGEISNTSSYKKVLKLHELITDPQGEVVRFHSVKWDSKYTSDELAFLQQLIDVDTSKLSQGELTISKNEGEAIPPSWFGREVKLRFTATDTAENGQILSENFIVSIPFATIKLNTPEVQTLVQGGSTVDLFDYLSTEDTGYSFKVTGPGVKDRLVQVSGEDNNQLSVLSSTNISNANTAVNIEVLYEGKVLEGAGDELKIAINTILRKPTSLNSVILELDGTGSFSFAKFPGSENGEVSYNIALEPENASVVFNVEKLEEQGKIKVSYSGAQLLDVNSVGKVVITASKFGHTENVVAKTSFRMENQAPTGTVTNLYGKKGTKLTNSSFTFTDRNGHNLTGALYGNLPSNVTHRFVYNRSGHLELKIEGTPQTTGKFSLTVEVTDDGQPPKSIKRDFIIDIGNPPPPPNRAPQIKQQIANQSIFEGESLSIPLSGYFEDPDGDSLTYSVSPRSQGMDVKNGKLVVTEAFSRSNVRNIDVEVFASDRESVSKANKFTLTIKENNVPKIEVLSAPTLYEGRTSTITFKATDPDGHSATITNIEGIGGLPFVISSNPPSITVRPEYGNRGKQHFVRVYVTDSLGKTGSQVFNFKDIRFTNRPPVGATSIRLDGTQGTQLDHAGEYYSDPDAKNANLKVTNKNWLSDYGLNADLQEFHLGGKDFRDRNGDNDSQNGYKLYITGTPNRSGPITGSVTIEDNNDGKLQVSVYINVAEPPNTAPTGTAPSSTFIEHFKSSTLSLDDYFTDREDDNDLDYEITATSIPPQNVRPKIDNSNRLIVVNNDTSISRNKEHYVEVKATDPDGETHRIRFRYIFAPRGRDTGGPGHNLLRSAPRNLSLSAPEPFARSLSLNTAPIALMAVAPEVSSLISAPLLAEPLAAKSLQLSPSSAPASFAVASTPTKTLTGGRFSDTYTYNLGDGDVIIEDEGGSGDKLVFGEGITPDNITISGDAEQLIFIFTFSDGGTLRYNNWYNGRYIELEKVEFADGTLWNAVTLGQQLVIGTSDDDNFDFSGAHVSMGFKGGTGDDVIKGGRHSDTYHYSLGDGHDVITDAGGSNDKIVFGEGINPDDIQIDGTDQQLVFRFADGGTLTVNDWYDGQYLVIESVEFADGTRWSRDQLGQRFRLGSDGNDNFDFSIARVNLGHEGGLGDDLIQGGYHSDSYYYNLGDGHDVITDAGGSNDKIVFGEGINPDDIQIDGTDQQLVFRFADGGTLTVNDWYDGQYLVMESVEFADGTRWSRDQLGQRFRLGSDGNDNFDFSIARVNLGHEGGLGDDVIKGGRHSDTYHYNLGDGNDTYLDSFGWSERLHLEGISDTDVRFYRNGDDILVHIQPSDHVITVKNALVPGGESGRIETYVFTNVELRNTQVEQRLEAMPANIAPGHRAMADYRVVQGEQIEYDVTPYFSDANGDTLTYTSSALPEGLTLVNGVLTGRVTVIGDHAISVTASDGVSSNTEQFTLTIDGVNTKPEYAGETFASVRAGEFIRVSVPFTDADDDVLTTRAEGLPSWLSYDANTNEVFGFAPINGEGSVVTLNLFADDKNGGTDQAQLTIDIKAPYQASTTYVQLQSQSVNFDESLNFDFTRSFNSLSGELSYQVELQQDNGSYQTLPNGHWLSVDNGVLTGAANLGLAGKEVNLRLSARNEQGDVVYGEMSVQVTGPSSRDVGKVEEVTDRRFSINAKDFFTGLGENARYGVTVQANRPEASNSVSSLSASPSVQSAPALLESKSVSARSVSLNGPLSAKSVTTLSSPVKASSSLPQADDTEHESVIDIPAEFADWLSFDPQTGLLSGRPPQGFIDELVFTFTATQGDITLTSNGTLDVGEGAKSQTFWFDYDAKGQVTIDGGLMTDNDTISISDQGQYFEYDALGRTSLVISDGGYNAQTMTYSDQGYLLSASQVYGNAKIQDGVDLFNLRKNSGSLDSFNFTKVVEHNYDLLGQVTSTIKFFGPSESRTVSFGDRDSGGYERVVVEIAGIEKSKETFAYNGDGDMVLTSTHGWGRGDLDKLIESHLLAKYSEQNEGNNDDEVKSNIEAFSEDYDVLQQYLRANLESKGKELTSGSYEFDKGGRLSKTIQTQHAKSDDSGLGPEGFTHTYEYTYEGRDSYLEEKISAIGDASRGQFQPATTESFYDLSGNRTAVEEKFEGSSTYDARYFDYSADGKLLKKQSGVQNTSHFEQVATAPNIAVHGVQAAAGEKTIANTIGYKQNEVEVFDDEGNSLGKKTTASHYMYSGNSYLGELTENGDIRVKQQHFVGFDSTNAMNNSNHQVQQGDTLQSIAQLHYGNANFWYVIADANGLDSDPDAELTVGQNLVIPQQQNNQNSFDNLLPANLAEMIGDTNPGLAYIPPPAEAGCNVIATVIMIAVAAAVTGGLAAYGTNAFLAGAIGSAASQLTGMALGAVDKFSWKQVAVAAVSAGVSKGFTNQLDLSGVGGKFAQGVVRGAVNYGVSHVASKLIGQPASFSWANLAASSIGYAAGTQVGSYVADKFELDFDTHLGAQFSSELTSGVAELHISRALGENTKVDYGRIGTDAFGNAVGNVIAARMNSVQKGDNSTTSVATQTAPSNSTDAGVKTSQKQGAKNLTQENALEKWKRLQASGELENLTSDEYHDLSVDANAVERSMYGGTRRTMFTNVVMRSNVMWTNAQREMNYLSRRTEYNSADNIIDRIFKDDIMRGEAMYLAGTNSRPQYGLDIDGFNQKVDAFIQFRDAQRASFQAEYNSYNGLQKFGFNVGTALFGGLINGGQAIGDATALFGLQGGEAFSNRWSSVGSTISYVAQNPVDALVINPVTAAYDRYSGIYNSDGFGAAAGTFAGDLLSGVPFAASGFTKPLTLPRATIKPSLDIDILNGIEINGTSAKRILPGHNGKIAIIGRSMHGDGGVVDYATGLNKRGYQTHLFAGDEISSASRVEWDFLKEVYGDTNGIIPQHKLMGTTGYKENKAWAQKVVDEGYTIIDIGNPNNQGFSVYYATEKRTIFGGR